MKKTKFILGLLLLAIVACNSSQNTKASLDTTKIKILDTTSVREKPKKPIDLEELSRNAFFSNKKLNAGTWAILEFKNDSVSITLDVENQNGEKVQYTIIGKYKLISENSLSITWKDNYNAISYFTTHIYISCSSSGMTRVNQRHIFPKEFNVDWGSNSILFNSTFQQEYYSGMRCGDENKEKYTEWDFDAN
jgi:hypothetical protein